MFGDPHAGPSGVLAQPKASFRFVLLSRCAKTWAGNLGRFASMVQSKCWLTIAENEDVRNFRGVKKAPGWCEGQAAMSQAG